MHVDVKLVVAVSVSRKVEVSGSPRVVESIVVVGKRSDVVLAVSVAVVIISIGGAAPITVVAAPACEVAVSKERLSVVEREESGLVGSIVVAGAGVVRSTVVTGSALVGSAVVVARCVVSIPLSSALFAVVSVTIAVGCAVEEVHTAALMEKLLSCPIFETAEEVDVRVAEAVTDLVEGLWLGPAPASAVEAGSLIPVVEVTGSWGLQVMWAEDTVDVKLDFGAATQNQEAVSWNQSMHFLCPTCPFTYRAVREFVDVRV